MGRHGHGGGGGGGHKHHSSSGGHKNHGGGGGSGFGGAIGPSHAAKHNNNHHHSSGFSFFGNHHDKHHHHNQVSLFDGHHHHHNHHAILDNHHHHHNHVYDPHLHHHHGYHHHHNTGIGWFGLGWLFGRSTNSGYSSGYNAAYDYQDSSPTVVTQTVVVNNTTQASTSQGTGYPGMQNQNYDYGIISVTSPNQGTAPPPVYYQGNPPTQLYTADVNYTQNNVQPPTTYQNYQDEFYSPNNIQNGQQQDNEMVIHQITMQAQNGDRGITLQEEPPPDYHEGNTGITNLKVKKTSDTQYGIDAYNDKNYDHAKGYFLVVLKKTKKVENREAANYYLTKITLRQGDLNSAQVHAKDNADLYNQILEHINEVSRHEKLDFNMPVQAFSNRLAGISIALKMVEEAISKPELNDYHVDLNKRRKELKYSEAQLLTIVAKKEQQRLEKAAKNCFGIGNGAKAREIGRYVTQIEGVLQLQKNGDTDDTEYNFTPLLKAMRSKRASISPFSEATSWKAVPDVVRRKLK